MKIISKYCFTMLFSLLLTNTSLVAAEPKQLKEKIIVQQGKLIWADLYTSNIKASLSFYTDTFGWTVKKFGINKNSYHILYDGEQAIAGILSRSAQRKKTETALWIGSIATDNVQASVNSATHNNAITILEPHDFALYGKRAVIADPQGGIIALLDIKDRKKTQQKISNKWNWAQLFSVNPKNAAAFYQNTFNYTVKEVTQNQSSYYLSQQDEIRASIVKLPVSFEQRDRWVNFVAVANLVDTLSNATKNGAEIIYQPEGNQLAIITDPNGALLGLTEQESK